MRVPAFLRIARWEVASGAGGVDRRAALLAGLALLVVAATVPAVVGGGAAPDAGIYRAGVAPSNPYRPALTADRRFTVSGPSTGAVAAGRLDLLVERDRIVVADDRTGHAAAAAFREAVRAYNDRLMAREPDQAAAFPVSVHLEYVTRDVQLVRRAGGGGATSGDAGAGGGSPASGDGGSATGTNTGSGGREPTASGGTGTATGGGPTGGGGVPDVRGGTLLTGTTTGTPADISPPFPFVSLVLAFAFVVPMNFVIQAYASSILHERTNRRGELLLIAPVRSATIVAGKTLPYLLAMLGLAGATAVAVGGGPLSLLAVTPVALLFLACAFVGGLLARSHKELTFVLVTVSVVVTTYVFVPAIFTQVHPIAAISPLSLVVHDLAGTAVPAGTVAFATVPMAVAAATLFGLGLGLYREEDLFAQRPLPAKVLDALANPIRGRASAALLSALSIPFVFVAELLAVAVLFLAPLSIGLPVLLVVVAAVEELAKSLHVYAGYRRGRYAPGLRAAVAVGAASGAGFFLAEKAAAAAQLVGLTGLPLGRAAFEVGAGTGGATGAPLLAALLLAPLGLHVATAGVDAVGASRGRRAYVAALVLAVAVHAAYDLAVVSALAP